MRDGIPYAIDFLNPAPDADVHSVGADNFTVGRRARHAQWLIERAEQGPEPITDYHWQTFLAGRDVPAKTAAAPRPRKPAVPRAPCGAPDAARRDVERR